MFAKDEWKITDFGANTDKDESIRIGCVDESVLGIHSDRHIAFASDYSNACLISSAPDLYYALKAILDKRMECHETESSYIPPEIEMAYKAIAKAEGKT